jgi:hypothetical protein
MVTHDPVAASYADLVVVLADGRLVDDRLVDYRVDGGRRDEIDRPMPDAVVSRTTGLGG